MMYHSLNRPGGLHTAPHTLHLRLICYWEAQAGGDLATPFPKPFSSPAGTETLHICSLHGNYENLLPYIVFLFLTMEQSHDFNRKNNSGIGHCLDWTMDFLVPMSEPLQRKDIQCWWDGGWAGQEHGQHMLIAGWPSDQVAFQDEKQYEPNKLGAHIYWC